MIDLPPWILGLLSQPALHATAWLLVCGAIFASLHHLTPHDRAQPLVRRDAWIDVAYWIGGPVVYAGIAATMATLGFLAIFGGDAAAAADYARSGAAWAQDVPLWAQALMALIVTDFMMYWTHRLFHSGRLWRYHAVHHSAENMDWLHAVRFHPVNYVFHGLLANSVVLWMGFSPGALILLIPFNTLYSAMVHANLDWTFGPFRHVLASPVFHRWHHTGPDEGGSSNFAPTFPVFDLMFGTFYMPMDRRPGATGLVERDMPESLIGQLAYPFRQSPQVRPSDSPALTPGG